MTGSMQGAHPTSPGGMSMAQLKVELVEKHGFKMGDLRGHKFPFLIDAVIAGRLAREAEAREAAVSDESDTEEALLARHAAAQERSRLVNHGVVFVPDETSDDDIDALMAELDDLTADAEQITEPLCGCGWSESAHEDSALGHEFIDASLYPEELQIKLDTGIERPLDAAGIAGTFTDLGTTQPHPEIVPLFLGLPGVRDYIFDGHRGTGPSAAERWMDCTASLGAARAFLETLTPNQRTEFASGSMAARQGTTAHAVAETQARVLLGEIDADEAELSLLELAVHPAAGEDYDEEMEGYVAEYVDYVKSFVDEGREVLIESRVTATIPLLSVTDGEEDTYDLTGSLDLAVLPEPPLRRKNNPDRQRLKVGDLKYGEGIDVSVESNPQIRIYALAVLALIVERYDGLPEWLTDVDYVIVQPRLGGIKVWSETVDELLDWQDNVLSIALTEALGGQRAGAKFSPSDSTCQWCPARGGCPALLELRTVQATDLFDVMIENDGDGFPETSALSDADLAKFYTQVRGLVKLHDDLKDELQRRAYRGQQIPGYGLVNYQPPRSWTPEAAEELDPANREHGILAEQVAAQLWQSKLVSPTAAEKLLGEQYAQIERLVVKPDKRPVIAPEGDRRSKWTGRPPEEMFAIEKELD